MTGRSSRRIPAFFIGEFAVGGFTEVSEVRQAEAFSVYDLIPETSSFFPQIEKGVQVSFISILVLGTDIAGVLFCADPHTDGIFTAFGFFEFSQKRTFSGTKEAITCCISRIIRW